MLGINVRRIIGLLELVAIVVFVCATWDWFEPMRLKAFSFVDSVGAFVSAEKPLTEVTLPPLLLVVLMIVWLMLSSMYAFAVTQRQSLKDLPVVVLFCAVHFAGLVLVFWLVSAHGFAGLFSDSMPEYSCMWAGRLALAAAFWLISYVAALLCSRKRSE